jgi:hypothetical protein
MWQSLITYNYHFNNITKKKKKFVRNHIEKIKTCNSSKNGHILYNQNNIGKI